jgi:hypothetical protein
MNTMIARLFGRSGIRTPPPEVAIDGWYPPELAIGAELARLKVEQGRALAANEPARAAAIHARRVALYAQLQDLQK